MSKRRERKKLGDGRVKKGEGGRGKKGGKGEATMVEENFGGWEC